MKIFTVQYEGDENDSLIEFINKCSNAEYLRSFFKKYKHDYEKQFGSLIVREAVKRTVNDSKSLFRKLRELKNEADKSKVDELFSPFLDKEQEDPPYDLQKMKSYQGGWLRLFALRYEDGYVITGGGIKLTRTTNTRPHLQEQMMKMDLVKGCLDKGNVEMVYLEL